MARRSVANKEIHLRSITRKIPENHVSEDIITKESFNYTCVKMIHDFLNNEFSTRMDIFRVMRDGKLKHLISICKTPQKN